MKILYLVVKNSRLLFYNPIVSSKGYQTALLLARLKIDHSYRLNFDQE